MATVYKLFRPDFRLVFLRQLHKYCKKTADSCKIYPAREVIVQRLEISRVQSLEISRVQSLEIYRLCTLEIYSRCTIEISR